MNLKFAFVLLLVHMQVVQSCDQKIIQNAKYVDVRVAARTTESNHANCASTCIQHDCCQFYTYEARSRTCSMHCDTPPRYDIVGGYWAGSVCAEKCISGEAKVLKVTENGIQAVEVSSLSKGDVVRGMDGNGLEANCEVTVSKMMGHGMVVGDFTPGHFVVALNSKDEMVVKDVYNTPEKTKKERKVDLYDVFTTCPVVETEDSRLFTPISDVFCGNVGDGMSWSDYKNVFAFISNAISITGPDAWLTMSNYVSNDECHDEDWKDALPHICNAVVDCGIQIGQTELTKEMATETEKNHCHRMKEEINDFIECHMNGNAQAKMIEHVEEGSSMGEVMVQAFLDSVGKREASTNWWFYALIVLSVSSLIAGGIVYYSYVRKSEEYIVLLEESE